jgi:archaellum component FlaF (FlaF/FlaG flagellin family)
MDHLAEDVKEAIENASNIDLSGYQSKEDEELVTNNKTVIGAINELFQNANNGKELIASAIGEPLNSEDTFSAMSNDINSLLSTFKTNMMNNGITVESSDRFKQLIDKIATMVEEGSGKGIQFVTGKYDGNYETRLSSITISTNANFIPTYVFCEVNIYKYDSYTQESISGIMSNLCSITARGNSSLGITMTNINADSFTLNWSNPSPGSYNYTALSVGNWYAIGVGEEDTTLRDSLASILQEEGVSVTNEDNMASLISKVDEEFDRQVVPAGDAVAANVLNGKTFINSTGQLVTGAMPEHGSVTYVDKYINYTFDANSVYIGIPLGAYNYPTKEDFAEVYFPKSMIPNLSPENIVSGKEILGIWGNASASSYVSGSDSTYKSTPGRQIVERVTIQTNLGFVPSNLIVRFKSNSSYGYEMQYFTVCSALNTNKATGVFFNLGISAWFYLENVNANSFDIVSEVSNQNYKMNYSEIQWMAYK